MPSCPENYLQGFENKYRGVGGRTKIQESGDRDQGLAGVQSHVLILRAGWEIIRKNTCGCEATLRA
jgi:hypothetical protein